MGRLKHWLATFSATGNLLLYVQDFQTRVGGVREQNNRKQKEYPFLSEFVEFFLGVQKGLCIERKPKFYVQVDSRTVL